MLYLTLYNVNYNEKIFTFVSRETSPTIRPHIPPSIRTAHLPTGLKLYFREQFLIKFWNIFSQFFKLILV